MAPTPPFSLAGRTALVTGSSTGLGKAVAACLGHAGAKVALNYANNQAVARQPLLNFARAALRPISSGLMSAMRQASTSSSRQSRAR